MMGTLADLLSLTVLVMVAWLLLGLLVWLVIKAGSDDSSGDASDSSDAEQPEGDEDFPA